MNMYIRCMAIISTLVFSAHTLASISYITSTTDSGNDNEASLTVPASVIVNDVLLTQVVIRNRNGSDGVTAPSGWALIGQQENDGDVFQSLYYRVATAADAGTSYEWDFDGNGNGNRRRYILGMSVFRGADTSDPIDRENSQTGMAGNRVTAPSVTTSASNAMLVGFYGLEAGGQSFTPATGMVEAYDVEENNNNNGVTAMAAYGEQVSAGVSGDKVATATKSNDDAIGQLIALNENPSSPLAEDAAGSCLSDSLIVVTFASPVDSATMTDPSNYAIDNGATITNIVAQDSTTAVLTIDALDAPVNYTLTVGAQAVPVRFNGALGSYWDQRSGAGGSKVQRLAGLFTGNRYYSQDPQIAFSWGTSMPDAFPSGSSNSDDFSIQWESYVVPSQTGVYRFRTRSDDGIRVSLDGSPLITTEWSDHGPRYSPASGDVALDANGTYLLLVEFYERGGGAVAELEWSRDGGGWEVVPTANYSSCPVVAAPTPTADIEYRMDEASWNGVTGEVIDSSGNGNNGTAQGGANTVDPGQVCRAGEFDGVDDYIETNAIDGALRGTSSLAFWIKTTQTGDDTGWQAPGVAGIEQSGGADDIFWGWLDASGHIGISVANDFSTKSTFPINDNVYHHVVLTRDAASGAYKIYIDGALNSSGNTASGVIGNGFSSIGRIEDTGGTPEYFRGELDELKVFSSVLSDSDVTTIYNETRPCASTGPIAHYAFEQAAWSGAGVTIEDYSGNGNEGVSLGVVADNSDGYVCQGVDIPDNNSVNTIDAINSLQDVNDTMGNEGTIMMWYRAVDRWNGGGDRTLMDASTRVFNNANDKYFYLSKRSNGSLRFSLEDSADRDFNLDTGNNNFAAGTWVHVSVVWDMPNNSMQVFINGTEEASLSLNSNGVLGDVGAVYFGDNSSTYNVAPGRSAYGRVDEIRLYADALSESEISTIMSESHPCATGSCVLGSFAITQPTYGLACPQARAQIDIQAMCADGVTVKDDYTGTIDLTSSENSQSEFYQSGTGGSPVTSYTFTGTELGDVNFYLFHKNENPDLKVTADDNVAGISTEAPTGTNFRTSGFAITAPTDFTCGGNTSMTLTAIGQDTSGGGSCSQLTGFSGSKGFKAWSDVNIDPTELPGVKDSGLPVSVLVDGQAVAESTPSSNNISLNFTSGVSAFPVSYLDAGEVLNINMVHDDAPYDGSVPLFSPLAASSGRFIVSPDHVEVTPNSALAACSAPLANCTRLAKANAPFAITGRAVCGDGASSVAQSYRGTVGLTHQLVAPTTGVVGLLDVTQLVFDGTGSTAGEANEANEKISEVGVFTLTNTPPAYFGQAIEPWASSNIGRFYPDQFRIGIVDSTFQPSCTSLSSFTYMDEPFLFLTAPEVAIEALNVDGDKTENYEGDFWKLGADLVEDSSCSGTGTIKGFCYADNVAGVATLSAPSSDQSYGDISDAGGEVTLTLHDAITDEFVYGRPSASAPAVLVSPFDADVELTIDLSDSDSVTGSETLDNIGFTGDADTGGTNLNATNDNLLRYGRLNLENAFGPETDSLSIPMLTQYYNGTTFVNNTDDSCSTYNAVDMVIDLNLANSGSTSASGSGTVTSGEAPLAQQVILSAPGLTHEGSAGLCMNVDNWLKFDWNENGLDLTEVCDATSSPAQGDNPTSVATFGRYRGHDRIIYWRELSN